MEKIERKQSVDSDQKEKGFLAINSLGELLPIILIVFFFAYLAGNQQLLDSTTITQKVSTQDLTQTTIIEEQRLLSDKKAQEEKTYLNTSPLDNQAKILPLIESKKEQVIQKRLAPKTEEDIPRPQFPKTSPREVLPTLEVSQPTDIPSSSEAFTSVEIELNEETILEVKPKEKFILTENIKSIKVESVKTLDRKEILGLAEIKIEPAEMTVKSNWKPRPMLFSKENEELSLVDESAEKSEEVEFIEKITPVKTYNSSDFKWAVKNNNHGIKKSADFTNTPDGKASYCRTDAGIILRVNDLSGLDSTFGIFVEKSEDGEEYNSIGVINAENTKGLFYFDAEHSFDGQHHYRFRSTSSAGEELEFGKVSVIRKASISPILSEVNAAGAYNLTLDSKLTQAVRYEVKEAWGSLNEKKGIKQLSEGENSLSFDLAGDPGLYFLTISTKNQVLDLLIEKPGISPDLSFYEQEVSGKQSFGEPNAMPFFINQPNTLNFDFYLKNGNTLIFNEVEYNSETVKIKKAKIGELPKTLQARHSEEMLWFTASSDISYLHQKVPVILEHKEQEIAAQINIFASKNAIRPISHFSPNGDNVQDNWRIPGIESCPNTNLMVFNDWGNLIYKTDSVTEENIWKGQKNGKDQPAGMYYYVLGQYGGWVQLQR